MITEEEIKLVSKSLEVEFYRYKRYNTPVTVVIFDTYCEHLNEVLKTHIRKTDIYEKISDTKLVLILTHTEKEGALALIEKYTNEVKSVCPEIIKVGYSHVKPEDDLIEDVIKRVAISLKLANEEFTNNIISI